MEDRGQKQSVNPAHLEGKEDPKRPFILGLVAAIFCAQAFLIPSIFIAFLLLPSTTIMIYNGEEVAVGEKRLEVVGSMLSAFIFTAYVGPGLWRGKPTARNVAFAAYVGLPLVFLTLAKSWAALLLLPIFGGLVGYYLYWKPNVSRFFDGPTET